LQERLKTATGSEKERLQNELQEQQKIEAEKIYAANTQKVDRDYVEKIARINRDFDAAWNKRERLLVAKCAKRNLSQASTPRQRR